MPLEKVAESKKLLRIGIIVPQFPSYTETFFIHKVIGLCERGHQVIVFCSNKIYNGLLEESYGLKKYPNLHVISFDFSASFLKIIKSFFLHPVIFLKNIRDGKKKFRGRIFTSLCKLYFLKYACDIYHFGYSGTAIFYMSVMNKLPGKIVISCLGTAENVKPVTEANRVEQLKKLFDKAHKIHCVSYNMAKMLYGYGADQNKIFINRPAIDTTFFCRNKEYTEKDNIRILSVGRLVFQKGFLMGILAVTELKKQFENFMWTIIGDGPEREQLIFHINALGLNDHVQLAGKKLRDEVIQSYEESDILFLPSVSEGLANVVLEAMSMELPVVASINGGIGEVITHNVNGILVPNYDYQLMSCQLHSLCIDFKKRKQLGQEARKTIETSFALRRYIDVFEEEYLKLVQ